MVGQYVIMIKAERASDLVMILVFQIVRLLDIGRRKKQLKNFYSFDGPQLQPYQLLRSVKK